LSLCLTKSLEECQENDDTGERCEISDIKPDLRNSIGSVVDLCFAGLHCRWLPCFAVGFVMKPFSQGQEVVFKKSAF
jgi:hypothetical protein